MARVSKIDASTLRYVPLYIYTGGLVNIIIRRDDITMQYSGRPVYVDIHRHCKYIKLHGYYVTSQGFRDYTKSVRDTGGGGFYQSLLPLSRHSIISSLFISLVELTSRL
jgi:hypothetical protein